MYKLPPQTRASFGLPATLTLHCWPALLRLEGMDTATQTALGQTLAQTLLDLEDDHLGWDKVKPSFSYKQRAWVNAAEQLVATPVADPVAELRGTQGRGAQAQDRYGRAGTCMACEARVY